MKVRALLATAALLVAGCTSADAPDAGADAVSRFVETWAEHSDERFRAGASGAVDELAAAITSLRGQGVTRFSVRSLRSDGGTVTGVLLLHFDDGAVLESRMTARVRDDRVMASPSLVSSRLASWGPLSVEEVGSPHRGTLLSRTGAPLTTRAPESRAARPDLEPAVALMERALGRRFAGRRGRVLLIGAERQEVARVGPADGDDVTTSLDEELQARAVEALGEEPGALVALDPRDGGIRALVTNPHRSAPDVSPAGDAHLPGSTFKIVTAVAAARAGVLRPDQMIDCPARLIIAGHTIHNFEGAVAGRITMRDALARSCNTAFAQIGSALGFQRIVSAARDLGIDGRPTAGAAPSRISIPRNQAEIATLAIGASTVVATPVAMAGVAATVASEGRRVSPRWEGGGSAGVRVLEADDARNLLEMMEAVIASGTGRAAAIPGATLAGKTGTAEVLGADGEVEGTDAWFVAIAPSRSARLVVVCYLPRAGVGGRVAAPMVRTFLESARESWDR